MQHVQKTCCEKPLKISDLFIRSAAAEAYNNNTGKYGNRSQNLLPCKCVHANPYAYGNGNQRLYIRVHAYKGGAYALLTNRDEVVCHYGAAEDKEGKFPQHVSRQCEIVY